MQQRCPIHVFILKRHCHKAVTFASYMGQDHLDLGANRSAQLARR